MPGDASVDSTANAAQASVQSSNCTCKRESISNNTFSDLQQNGKGLTSPVRAEHSQEQDQGDGSTHITQSPIQQLAYRWEELSDVASGRPYYYHAEQSTTVWERPV